MNTPGQEAGNDARVVIDTLVPAKTSQPEGGAALRDGLQGCHAQSARGGVARPRPREILGATLEQSCKGRPRNLDSRSISNLTRGPEFGAADQLAAFGFEVQPQLCARRSAFE